MGNAIINPSMINNCIRCRSKLIPIVYGRLDPEVMDMQDKGLLLISLDSNRTANSYCPLCEEAYSDFTISPDFSSLEDKQNSLE